TAGVVSRGGQLALGCDIRQLDVGARNDRSLGIRYLPGNTTGRCRLREARGCAEAEENEKKKNATEQQVFHFAAPPKNGRAGCRKPRSSSLRNCVPIIYETTARCALLLVRPSDESLR